MAIAAMTSKGQITVPADIRKELGLKAGDRVDFRLNQRTKRYEFVPMTKSIKSLYGMFHVPGRHFTIKQINEAIAKAGASAGKIYR